MNKPQTHGMTCHPQGMTVEVTSAHAKWALKAGRLLDSAPELLEALQCVVAALTQPVQTSNLGEHTAEELRGTVSILRGDAAFAVKAARQAISKATGAQ